MKTFLTHKAINLAGFDLIRVPEKNNILDPPRSFSMIRLLTNCANTNNLPLPVTCTRSLSVQTESGHSLCQIEDVRRVILRTKSELLASSETDREMNWLGATFFEEVKFT